MYRSTVRPLECEAVFCHSQGHDCTLFGPIMVYRPVELRRDAALQELATKPTEFCWRYHGRPTPFGPDENHFVVLRDGGDVERSSYGRKGAIFYGIGGEF